MRLLLLFVTAIFCLQSCKVVSTLHPISENEKDFLFKKELIGKWGDPKDNSGFYKIDTVAGTMGKLYSTEIVSHEKDKGNAADTNWFLLRLVKINDWYFADLKLDMHNTFGAKEGDYNDWLVTKHFFCNLSFISPDKIELSFPDPDELIKLIDVKKIMLDYYMPREDDYLITNKSGELQKGLAESKKYPSLYKDKSILNRIE